MDVIVNDRFFQSDDRGWIDFYNKHGWVVIKNNLNSQIIKSTILDWENLKKDCAKEMGIQVNEYELEISQWRDLWTNGGTFKELIFSPYLHSIAQDGMGWNGSRLLHDHLICKPFQGSNKKIPWHQDSMFWPVDIPGCSTWTALENVSLEDGCLEVIDKSHLEGCEEPIDFMAKEREDFPDGSIKVSLPVNKGSTILLHSLTWHRSSINQGLHDRPAHIGLWIHPDSKWRPDLVDWHPINQHVESEPMARLEGSKFPHFGNIDVLESPDEDIHQGTTRYNDISMFDASKIVSKQLAEISGGSGGILEILGDEKFVSIISQKTIENKFCIDDDEIKKSLERLRISYLAYELHKARNVYNDAYANWWDVAGNAWNELLMVDK
jgi:ectoine hydroxylase-related dioxygenase (phytanoyl-CoA dioxygenase family)